MHPYTSTHINSYKRILHHHNIIAATWTSKQGWLGNGFPVHQVIPGCSSHDIFILHWCAKPRVCGFWVFFAIPYKNKFKIYFLVQNRSNVTYFFQMLSTCAEPADERHIDWIPHTCLQLAINEMVQPVPI